MMERLSQPTKQNGIALISSLIIMLLMTVVALSLMRGTSLFEKIAGNTREKQRAFQSAQDALQFAEFWLQQTATPTALTGAACSSTLTSIQVCTGTGSDPGTLLSAIYALPSYSGYKPPSMTVASGGGLSASGDVNYSKNPSIYINPLGTINSQPVFRITAIGYAGSGGKNGTVAVVQSIFAVTGGGSSGNSGGGNTNTNQASTGTNIGGA